MRHRRGAALTRATLNARAQEALARQDQLGGNADRIMREVRQLERNLRERGASPEHIAQEIEAWGERNGHQIGKIDPQQVADGKGWWNIDTEMGPGGRTSWSGKPWSAEERAALQRGLDERVPSAQIAEQITALSGRPLDSGEC